MLDVPIPGTPDWLASDPILWRIWAKWPRNPGDRRYHPLLCHMLDVAYVTRLMWDRALTRTQRQRIAKALGLEESDAATWVAFWAGLHDLGKASPSFQTQLKDSQSRSIKEEHAPLVAGWLRAAGLDIRDAHWASHGAISLLLLESLLPGPYRVSEELTQQVAAIVGAHHGVFFTENQKYVFGSAELIGDDKWFELQGRLAALVACALDLPDRAPQGILRDGDAMALAGLISVADWIGSNINYFPLRGVISSRPAALDVAAYKLDSAQRAQHALKDIAWDVIDLTGQPQDFTQLFPGKSPRAVQSEVIKLAHRLDGPGLVIIEVPMGEGKTEAAMYLADHWTVQLNQRGIYFALPTQATSNQMFSRVQTFLDRRYSDQEFVNLHLAHGMAALSEQYERLREREQVANASVYDEGGERDESDGEHGAVFAAEWFCAAKRTLLSPYGVGTIDQALLSILQVKHLFVRLFGLAGKTIIMDEVHAYDTYMSTLLERLLEWLAALGAPVVLLSATLPSKRRRDLLGAYAKGAGWALPAIEHTPYPRITYASLAASGSIPITATAKARSLQIEWVSGELPAGEQAEFRLADALQNVLRDGGCAAVICNTVRRAQEMYLALETAFARLPSAERPSLGLLHAQLPFDDRHAREDLVLAEFSLTSVGKRNPARPKRSVLVSTQVIEQSLDLDFDLMVSDLAPVDLLLQRAGRIHRHEENNPGRPERLKEPTLWICQPGMCVDGTPDFERSDEFIYSEHILLRTWFELTRRMASGNKTSGQIAIPADVEPLIERVYVEDDAVFADANESLAQRLERTQELAQRKEDRAQRSAKDCRILPPGHPSLYTDMNKLLEEDNPDIHRSLQARTRDGDLSVAVVLLDAEPAARFRRTYKPTRDGARALLGRSLNLSRKGLVEVLLSESVPTGWRKTPWLRNHRVICLDDEGQAIRTDGKRDYVISLDTTLGVVIRSQKKEV